MGKWRLFFASFLASDLIRTPHQVAQLPRLQEKRKATGGEVGYLLLSAKIPRVVRRCDLQVLGALNRLLLQWTVVERKEHLPGVQAVGAINRPLLQWRAVLGTLPSHAVPDLSFSALPLACP